MKRLIRLLVCTAIVAGWSGQAYAFHSWSNYHWARSQNPFTLRVIDSLTADWHGVAYSVALDWQESNKFRAVLAGQDDSQWVRRVCPVSAGLIRVCNAQYGSNGWLGLAEIWLNAANHIQYARTRMNDSYFWTATYNSDVARRHVLCMEVGHILGLDHQHGETGPTCMDDVNGLFDPNYVSPNAHDYQEIDTIYAHLDGGSSASTMSAQSNGRSDPNTRVEKDGQYTKITWVFPTKKNK